MKRIGAEDDEQDQKLKIERPLKGLNVQDEGTANY